jgi:poly(A) polymerase
VSPTVPERFRHLVEATTELAKRFEHAQKRLYLVGGSVRDALVMGGLGDGSDRVAKDFDFDLTTDARPEEIEGIITGWADVVWTQGARFGTIGCLARGRRYEITTHRAEVYRPDSRKPEVTFDDDIEVDLSRRDFTVNAMALRLPDFELIDPFNGLGDLAAGVLRTPLGPDVSFDDDPLRMLRAARFMAGYGLQPEPELVGAVKAGHHRLSIVSPERIRSELDRLVMVETPSIGLWFVVETGLAAEFLPEVPALALEQDPIHRHKDVLAHTLAVVDRTSPDRVLRLAALFHDIGKPKTRAFAPGGVVTFHHHEVVGARMTHERMEALRYPNEDVATVTRLVELHLRFHTYQLGWTDRAVRRYVRDAGPLLDRLNELTRCDCTTRNEAKARALGRRMDELENRIVELRELEELDAMRPDLDGNSVMELLGVAPGPAVGRALDFLLELRIEEGPLGEEEATRRLREWWSNFPES